MARSIRRTLRGTGWKPVFHDRLEAYPTPHRGVSRFPPPKHSFVQQSFVTLPLCLPLRALRLRVSLHSLPAGAEQAGSPFSMTGWKPILHFSFASSSACSAPLRFAFSLRLPRLPFFQHLGGGGAEVVAFDEVEGALGGGFVAAGVQGAVDELGERVVALPAGGRIRPRSAHLSAG